MRLCSLLLSSPLLYSFVSSFSLVTSRHRISSYSSSPWSSDESYGFTSDDLNRISVKLFSSPSDDDDDEDMSDVLNDRDWRAFRAKLVMSENESTVASGVDYSSLDESVADSKVQELDDDPDARAFAALDPTIWAYDTGNVIEQGAVILGGVEQSFGFGLRQQYFHKAVMLVLEHDERFTRGIILNRPSSRTILDEDEDTGRITQWKVWYGGDVQGLGSGMMEVVCLHSLQSDAAIEVSTTVINEIRRTSFGDARELVAKGLARPSDFWTFAGYAGWGPNQLAEELERKSWYMVATDSQTLLQQMANQAQGQDPRNAGLDTWTLLMGMIGKSDIAKKKSDEFDDLMLKEWAREHLLVDVEKSSYDAKLRSAPSTNDISNIDPIDRVIQQAAANAKGEYVGPGMLVRGSSADRSPYLLSKQELHKSIVLIVTDDEKLTTGAILNRPSSRGVQLQIISKITGSKKEVVIPLRYGGEYSIRGGDQSTLFWFHCSKMLQEKNVGSPLGINNPKGVWRCSAEEASSAIAEGSAEPTDFIVVSGLSIWTKGDKGISRGIEGEVKTGNFEIIPKKKVKEVYEVLLHQQVLNTGNIQSNLDISNEAWNLGEPVLKRNERDNDEPLDGIGDEYDEENDTLVFKSNTKLTTLSDKALRYWVATFLLGEPSLG